MTSAASNAAEYTIYVDGSCQDNKNVTSETPAGWGVVVVEGDTQRGSGTGAVITELSGPVITKSTIKDFFGANNNDARICFTEDDNGDGFRVVETGRFELITKAKKTRKKIEVEVENNADAILAATLGVDIIMLDNFTPKQIKNTIINLDDLKLRKKVKIEVSGGITEKNILQYAKTDVDMISVGEITNSVQGIDLSLEIN